MGGAVRIGANMSLISLGRHARKSIAGGLSALLILSSVLTPIAQASPFSTLSKGPGQELENQEENGFFNPFKIRERLESSQAVVREMKRREERQDYLKRKSLMDVLRNVQDAIQNRLSNQEEFEADMERRRRASAAIFGEAGGFSFVKYNDGKKVWFKGGQVSKIENEQVKDAHGNVSLRNMDDMQYNEKGLLVSYKSDSVDSDGNKQSVVWHGATYTDDSVAYGGEGTHYKKLITGYTEEITDGQGNTTVVDWRGATYDELDRLSSYKQTSADLDGNKTTKSWRDGQYDATGNLTSFNETVTDALGLTTERQWSGGTYEKNPAYIDKDKTPQQSAYLLVGYKETVTDSHGQTTARDWRDGRYNDFGELLSYNETLTKTVDGQTLTQNVSWSGGAYDEKGHLTTYHETKQDWEGQTVTVDWTDGEYNSKGQLTRYNEKTADAAGNETFRSWQAADGGYDSKGRLTSYTETVVDARGNSTQKTWTADQFDRYGRVLLSHETDVDPEGNSVTKEWSTDAAGYDAFGQVLQYKETTLAEFGNKTSKTWENGVYDSLGRLVAYVEIVVDVRGATHKTVVEGTTYNALGRKTSYKETRTDSDGNVETTVWSGGEYSAKGNLISYEEAFTNIYGETQKKSWRASDADYDRFGQLIGYQETITGFDGIVTERRRSGCEYDSLGRLSAYDETVSVAKPVGNESVLNSLVGLVDTAALAAAQSELKTEPAVVTTHTRWTGGTYDSLGRLIGYAETTTNEPGQAQVKTWDGAYNERGDLRSSHETLTDETGLTKTTNWTGYLFDDHGRATASRQIQYLSDEPGVALITTESGRTFDRYGQASGGYTALVTAGTNTQGQTFNLTTERTIGKATFADGALAGYSETSHTFGTDSGLSWVDNKEEKVVSHLSRTGYTETTTQGDHVVLVSRSKMTRDSLGHVVSYADQIQDAANGPTPTVSVRLATTFDSFDKPTSAVDHVTTPKGEEKIIVTKNIVQDSRGNSLAFESDTFEAKTGVQSLPGNWSSLSAEEQTAFLAGVQSQYPNARLEIDAEKNQVDISLLAVENRKRTSSHYDSLGRLVSSEDEIKSTEEKESRRVSWAAEKFDSANRAATDTTITQFFDGVISGSPSSTKESRRNLMTYNTLGQVSGYRERATDSKKPDEVVNREVSGVTYDTWGAVSTQKDVALTQEIKDGVTVSTKGNMTTESTRSDAQFDALGRLIGYDETVHQFGRSDTGDVINHYEKKRRTASRYDEAHPDRLLSYEENVTSSDAPGVLTTVSRDNLSFGLNNAVSEYTERVAKQGVLIGMSDAGELERRPLDTVQTVHRTGIVTSSEGNVTNYYEERTSSDRPAETERASWSGTYDEKNRLTGSQESVSVVAGNVEVEKTKRTRSAITFDSLDRMTHYLDMGENQVRLEDGTLSSMIVTTTERSDIQYNSLNQVTSYRQNETSSDSPKKTELVWSDGRYDSQGRLSSFTETTHSAGTDSTGASVDLTTTDKRALTSYNAFGQVEGTSDVKTSSDKPDVVSYEDTSRITYDEAGRQYSFIQKSHQVCQNRNTPLDVTVITAQSAATYDERGRVQSTNQTIDTLSGALQIKEKVSKSGLTYNAWGEVMSSQETRWSSQSPDKTTVVTIRVTSTDAKGRALSSTERTESGEAWDVVIKENMVWNDLNQLLAYDTRIRSSAQSQESLTEWMGTYDSFGRLQSYAEAKSDDGSDLRVETRRNGIAYNGLGQMVSYGESSRSSATPDLVSSLSWTALGYDVSGQLSGYTENQETVGPDTDIRETTTRSGMTYLRSGLIDGYIESRWSSTASNLTATTVRSKTRYDGFGREASFLENEITLAADGSLDTITKRERLASTYNAQNQLIGKQERTRSDASPDLTTTLTWIGSYSDRGLLASSQETDRQMGLENGRPLDKTTVSSVLNRSYDRYDRLLTEISSSNDGLGQTQTRSWSAGGYDAEGRITGETENVRRTGEGLEVETKTEKDRMTYDDQGRLLNYIATLTSSAEALTTRQQMSFTYNENGQHASEVGETFKVDTETNGTQFSSHQIDSRGDLVYDLSGRLVAFVDQLDDLSLGLTTLITQSNTSYNRLGIEVGFEQETRRTSIPEGVFDATEKTTHQVLYFNAKGQTTSSKDTQWSSAAPDKITTVETDQITYDKTGQIFSSRRRTESTSLSDSNPLYTYDEQIQTSASYDRFGRLIQDERRGRSSTSIAAQETVTESFSYNDLGQRTNSSVSSSRLTDDGRLSTAQTQMVTDVYDVLGRVSVETRVNKSSQSPGIETTETATNLYGEASLLAQSVTETSVKGSGVDQTTTVTRNNIVYDTAGRAVGYVDVKNSSEAPGVVTTSQTSGIQFNDLGQEMGYTTRDKKVSEAYGTSLNVETVATRSGVTYDFSGRSIGYKDVITDNSAVTKTIFLSGVTYDDLGFMSSKTEETRSAGEDSKTNQSLATLSVLNQNYMTYDTEGRLNGYEEKVTSTGLGESIRHYRTDAFNALGQASKTHETGHSNQEGTWTRDTEITQIDSQGRAALTHSEGDSSTAGSYDVWTTSIDEDGNVGFNSLGQATYQKETGVRHGLGNFTRTTESGFENSYDSLGRQNRARETLVTDSGTTVTDNISQTYDALGQLIKKVSTMNDMATGEPQRNTDQVWTATYDKEGRQSSVSTGGDTRILNSDGSLLGREQQNSVRSNIVYNENGQMADYDETVSKKTIGADKNTLQENETSVQHRNTQYNDDAQVTHYEESGTRDGGAFTETYDALSFSSSGEAVTWTKTGADAKSGPYRTDQTSGEVNEKGQFKNYVQSGVAGGQAYTKTVSDVLYDSKGRVKSEHEVSENDAGITRSDQSYEYDEFGRIKKSDETGTDSQGEFSSTTSDFVYDSNGQATSKIIVKTDSFHQTTTDHWIGAYDDKTGRLTRTHDGEHMVDAAGALVSDTDRTWDAKEFLDSGLLKEGITKSVITKADGSTETDIQTHTSTDPDADGLFTRSVDRLQTTTEFNGVINNTDQTTDHTNITRYTAEDEKANSSHHAGRVRGYEEKITKSDSILPAYTLVDNLEYNENGVEIGKDQASVSSDLLNKAEDLVIGVGAAIFSFLRFSFARLVQGVKSMWVAATGRKLSALMGDVNVSFPAAALLLDPTQYSLDIVHRTNGQVDEHGRVVAWQETTLSSSAPGKLVTSDVEVQYKGAGSELDWYQATNTEKTGSITTTTKIFQNGYKYVNGKVVEYGGTLDVVEYDSARQRETYTNHKEFKELTEKYDEQGRASQTVRTTTNDSNAPAVTKVETTGLSYNDSTGRVSGRHAVTTETAVATKTHEALDITTTSDETYFYSESGQLTSTHTESVSSASPEKTTISDTQMGNFDQYGRAQTTTTETKNKFINPTDPTQINYSDLETVTVDIRVFGPNGQAALFTQTTTKLVGEDGKDAKTEETKNLTNTFNELGQIIRTEGDVKDNRWLVGEQKVEASYHFIQETLAFNELGQATKTRYLKSNEAGSPNDFEISETTNEYDKVGQVCNSHTKNTTQYKGGYTKTWETGFNGTKKDARGNFTDFTQTTSKASDAPDASTIEDYKGTVYDANGHMTQSEVTTDNQGIGPDGKPYGEPKTEVKKWAYNAINQAIDISGMEQAVLDNIAKILNPPAASVDQLLSDNQRLNGELIALEKKKTDTKEALINQAWEAYSKQPVVIFRFTFDLFKSLFEKYSPDLKETMASIDRDISSKKTEIKINDALIKAATNHPVDDIGKWEIENGVLAGEIGPIKEALGRVLEVIDGEEQKEQEPLDNSLAALDSQEAQWKGFAKRGVVRMSWDEFVQKASDSNSWESVVLSEIHNFHLNDYYSVDQDGIATIDIPRIAAFLTGVRDGSRKAIAAAKKDITDKYDKKRDTEGSPFHNEITSREKQITANERLIQIRKDEIAYLSAAKERIEKEGCTSRTTFAYDKYGRIAGQKTWDGMTGETTEDSDFNYNNVGQQTGYRRVVRDKDGNVAPGKYKDITNDFGQDGRLIGNTTISTENLYGETHSVTSVNRVLERDGNGRVTRELQSVTDSFTDKKTDIQDITTTYEGSKVKSTKTDTSQKIGDTVTHMGWETHEAKSFDALGRVVGYVTKSQEDAAPDVINTHEGTNIYGKDGQLAGTDEIVTSKGSVLNTSKHELTLTTEWENGRPSKQLRLTTHDSTSADTTTLDTISYTYSKNEVKTDIVRTSSSPKETKTDHFKTDEIYGEDGRVLSRKTTVIDGSAPDKEATTFKDNIQYDAWGRELGYDETTTESSNNPNIKLNDPVTRTRSSQTYNSDGLLVGYREVEKDVVSNVTATSYDSQGRMTSQTSNRTWNGTVNGNISGLSGDWAEGNVTMTQSMTYDKYGRLSSLTITARGKATSSEFSSMALAGTGATQCLGVMGDFRFDLKRTNIKYDSQGRIVHYDQTTTQYGVTKESYLKSSRGWKGNRKAAQRDVVGLLTRNESVDTLEFDTLGRATKTNSVFTVSNGDWGWTKQENITYDSEGRMASATTESYYVTYGKYKGRGYTATVHSKKDQTFTYEENGKCNTKDINTYFDDTKTEMSASGNFFNTDFGKFTKIALETAVYCVVLYFTGNPKLAEMAAAATMLLIDLAVMDREGLASPKDYWKMVGTTVGIEILFMGIPGGSEGKEIAKEGGEKTTKEVGKKAIDEKIKEAVKEAAKKEIQAKIKKELVKNLIIQRLKDIPMKFVIMKIGEKIAERSGRQSAAFWTTLASSFISHDSSKEVTSQLKEDLTAGISNGLLKVGLMEVAENNQNQLNKGKVNSFLFQTYEASIDQISSAFTAGLKGSLGFKGEPSQVQNRFEKFSLGYWIARGAGFAFSSILPNSFKSFGAPSNSRIELLSQETAEKLSIKPGPLTLFGRKPIVMDRQSASPDEQREFYQDQVRQTQTALVSFGKQLHVMENKAHTLTKVASSMGPMLHDLQLDDKETMQTMNSMVNTGTVTHLNKLMPLMQGKQQAMSEAVATGDYKTAEKNRMEFSGLAYKFNRVASEGAQKIERLTAGLLELKAAVREMAFSKLSGRPMEKLNNILQSEGKAFKTLFNLKRDGIIPPSLFGVMAPQLKAGLEKSSERIQLAQSGEIEGQKERFALGASQINTFKKGYQPSTEEELGQLLTGAIPGTAQLAGVGDMSVGIQELWQTKGSDWKAWVKVGGGALAILPLVGSVGRIGKAGATAIREGAFALREGSVAVEDIARTATKAEGALAQVAEREAVQGKNLVSQVSKQEGKIASGARVTSEIANELPKNGLFARVMPKTYARDFLSGESSLGKSGERVFVTALDDLRGFEDSPRLIAARLSLFGKEGNAVRLRTDADTVVIFRLKETKGIASPIGDGPAWFKGHGITRGGAREWTLEQNISKDDIDILEIYTLYKNGGKDVWFHAAN